MKIAIIYRFIDFQGLVRIYMNMNPYPCKEAGLWVSILLRIVFPS
jgi:hypothetical protein